LRREFSDPLIQHPTAGNSKHAADFVDLNRVLLNDGMDAVLNYGPDPDKHHPHPRKLGLIAQLSGRNPDPGKRIVPKEVCQSLGVELGGFIDIMDECHKRFMG
jgi:hypothetical protein